MRHRKHRHSLGVKSAHRTSLLANLCASLIRHGRIKTTLAKAKALRPFAEKAVTLAKKAKAAEGTEAALHYRRIAISRIRDKEAVKVLFDEKAGDFTNRNGGYTRIYKLGARKGDAAEVAIIELIPDSDEGYEKRRKAAPAKKKEEKKEEAPVAEETATEEAPASEEADSKSE